MTISIELDSGLSVDEVRDAYDNMNYEICRVDISAVVRFKPDFLTIKGFFISRLELDLLSNYFCEYDEDENHIDVSRFKIYNCFIDGEVLDVYHLRDVDFKNNVITSLSSIERFELLDLEE